MWFDLYVNPALWALANLALLYMTVVLGLFVGLYFFGFKWREFPTGRSVMYFTASLFAVVLLVDLGVLNNILSASTGPWGYNADTFVWRPSLRLVVYLAVSFTVTHLFRVLWTKWVAGEPFNVDVDPRTLPSRGRR